MAASTRRQLTADALLLLVTVIWGGTFVTVKDATASFPVFSFLLMRFGLATGALFLIAARRLPSLGWRGVGAGMLIGFLLFGGYAFQTMGLRYTSASKAGFITGLSVVMVPILSALVLRRAPGFESVLGVCLATVGLGLLALTNSLGFARGDLLVLLCALGFALHIVSVSAFAPHSDPLALTFVQVATVTVASAAVVLLSPSEAARPTTQTWFAAAFTGVLATAVAFSLQTTMQRFTTPTHTALIFAGEPVFAAVFGVLLAHDPVTARGVAGGVLIIAGTVVSEVRWSERTARLISRFLSPQYVAVPFLLALGLLDPESWTRGLFWAIGIALLAIGLPVAIMLRELHKGGISDWHLSRREERLKPIPIVTGLVSTGLPALLLYLFDGPRSLLLGCLTALALVLFNLLVTLGWKISQHTAGIAATTTLVTALLGVGASPILLLIPLVAWARVKVGAHTIMQTVAGGAVGVLVSAATVYLMDVV
ncbi:MAG: DMT family transporter [Chloroflexi bacterium]|nr:DMT family transporter [Chloroflexota bacterium]